MKTKNLVKLFDDKGEQVMIPDDLGSLDRAKILFPATVKTIKNKLKSKEGVLATIKDISGYKMTKEEKRAVLFIASGFRLIRQF